MNGGHPSPTKISLDRAIGFGRCTLSRLERCVLSEAIREEVHGTDVRWSVSRSKRSRGDDGQDDGAVVICLSDRQS